MKILVVNPADNVAVAIEGLDRGENVRAVDRDIELVEPIPAGHKLALRDLAPADQVTRYGFAIGRATRAIHKGAWIHEHNMAGIISGRADTGYEPNYRKIKPIDDGLTFRGFVRGSGEVGIRNEIWIIPTVGCVNGTARNLAGCLQGKLPAGTDGIHALEHPLGCSQLGDDDARTGKIVAALARHPNAGGVLVLGLGCENNQVSRVQSLLEGHDRERIRFLICQDVGDEMAEGRRILSELAKLVSRDARVDVLTYGDRLIRSGLNIVDGPGNDLVAVTNLAAAGCQLILFTTGRGTPFGGPVPTLKISTNTDLAARKQNWIDFDAGPVLAGQSVKTMADELLGLVVATASGEMLTHGEQQGQHDIAILKTGITL